MTVSMFAFSRKINNTSEPIGPLPYPVTWYGINYDGTQKMQ